MDLDIATIVLPLLPLLCAGLIRQLRRRLRNAFVLAI